MPVGLGVAAVVLAGLLWTRWGRGKKPPGPISLPVIGSILSMNIEPFYKLFEHWRTSYGDVVSFKIGTYECVLLSGYSTIKEALVGQSVIFAGRPLDQFADRIKHYTPDGTMGIADNDYSNEWKSQRNVAVQILRKMGYGKNSISKKITEEARYLRQVLLDKAGTRLDPNPVLGVTVSNVICSMLYGERFEHSDRKFAVILETIAEMLGSLAKEPLADYIPVLKFRSSFKNLISDYKSNCDSLIAFHKEKIEERKQRLEEENHNTEPRDFIEGYLIESKKGQEGDSRLSEDWLYAILADFFIAGAETTATTLTWALLWMAHRRDIQEKVQAELDEVFGTEAVDISLDMRSKCTYTEATLMEIQRISAIAPISLPHKTLEDTELRGFPIKKNTEVYINLYSCLMDPEFWPEPEVLRPERFIKDDGTLDRPEQWVPFSMGRRMCLGEQLARQELFVFFASLLHAFHVRLPDGVEADLEGEDHLVMRPKPYEVIFESRF